MIHPRHGLLLAFAVLVAAGCSRDPPPQAPAPARVLNVFNWVDEIGPNTVREFEQRSGIRVNYTPLTGNNVLEARLLAGNAGFDIVVPSNNFVQRLVRAGALQPIDRRRLKNYANLDPALLARAADFDPGNTHTVPYLWGTNGIAIERRAVTAALGGPPPPSWALLFDPRYAAKLQACGMVWMESDFLVTNMAFLYLGIDTSTQEPRDLARAEELLRGARPHVRYFDNYRGDTDLLTGEVCATTATSGSILQARAQAKALGLPRDIEYFIPREGGMLWMDVLAIPTDAANVDAAYAFIDYMLEPRVIAAVTNATRFANANRESRPWIDQKLLDDPIVHPDAATMARLRIDRADSNEFSRLQARMYTRVRNQVR